MYSVINLLAVLLSIASLTSAAPIAPEPLHKLALRKAPLIRDGEVCLERYLHSGNSSDHADHS